ncbi:hypothetical protein [Algoriphagus marinus]|uniref:hypothetical protein n=1 Tax=Algoriphagus marinus TaxID=1925762 RepID=UPI00094BC4CD|nr:hypothetical protein [Algoriphagus marinus]
MKKILLLLLASGLFFESFAQSDAKVWIGIDGSYWQKSVKTSGLVSLKNENFGSLRPMIGLKLNQKWDLGIMMSFNSYVEEISPLSLTTFSSNFNEDGILISQDAQTTHYQTSIDNQLFGVGLFARRHFKLNERFSFNLSPYVLRESGNSGTMDFYYPYNLTFYDYCLNCLSIFPGPIEVPISEENWRFGVDAAFAFQASNWLKLEIRANLLELRQQTLNDERNNLSNGLATFDPFLSATQGYFGNYSDFGSAITREGIRFGLVFTPF